MDVGEEALRWLTVEEAAKRLRLGKSTVWRKIYAYERGEPGGIESLKAGGSRRITPEAIAAYEEHLRTEAQQRRSSRQSAA